MAEIRKNIMDNNEAEALVREWGDMLEVDTERDFFKDTVNELRIAVKKGRMNFDVDKEEFSYLLIHPVGDGEKRTEMVNIKECDMAAKKVLQKYKKSESIESAAALVSKYTGLSINQVNDMRDRDVSKINAVILGFFVQAATSTE